MRFQDSFLGGSARNQDPTPVNQPYPGDVAGLDHTPTGSIARNAASGGYVPRPQENVQAAAAQAPANPYQLFPPPDVSQPMPASAPVPAPVASLDSTVTGTVDRAARTLAPPAQPMPGTIGQLPQPAAVPAVAAADGAGGWTRAGGTQVTVKQGETVFNLSRRFGVPADAILKANGLSSGNALAAGQQIVIPTYVHSAGAPVSAPDAHPSVADARSSTGTRFDVPSGNVPVPSQAPSDRLAVLPQQPKVKAPQTGAQTAAADATAGASARSGATYTVVAGDTLNGIARKTGVGAQAIKEANGLSNGIVRIGQVLTLPAGATVPAKVAAVQQRDPVTTGTVQPAAQQETSRAVQEAARTPSEAAPGATGISRMRWPVRGRVISGFGGKSGGRKNDGIDIAVPSGTPIKAAENGVVIYAGDGLKEFGNTVLVRHENGLVTVYGHASEINVQRGQQVRRGDEIARAGMSGSADTPKLHFEVRKDSSPVDPVSYLE